MAYGQMNEFHVGFNYKVGTTDLQLDSTYADANGRNFSLRMVNYYLSNLKLMKADSSTIDFDEVLLVQNRRDSVSGDAMLGMIQNGSYIGFQFDIGLDSATNHADPNTYPAGHPLNLQIPSMHWSWNTGYLFFRIEGLYDNSLTGTEVPGSDMQYHVGNIRLLRRVTSYFDEPVTLTDANDMLRLELGLDILAVLDNIDLLSDNFTHTTGNFTLASTLASNMRDAFKVNVMQMDSTNTAVNEYDQLHATLFPNPAVDRATLQFNHTGGQYQFQVIDITGKMVLTMDRVESNRVDINTSELGSGMYLLHLSNGSESFSTRLLVQ